MNAIKSLLTSIFVTWLISCSQQNSGNSTRTPTWTDVIESTSNYHNNTVELEGYFVYEFEETVLYPETNSSFSEGLFWDIRLKEYPESFQDSLKSWNNGNITLVGIIDTTTHGHLGSYLAGFNVFKIKQNGRTYE